jgi:hypothetical protein
MASIVHVLVVECGRHLVCLWCILADRDVCPTMGHSSLVIG